MVQLVNYNTMLLDIDTWDHVVDASGNWAIAGPPYSQAQDASSAIRTWLGEVYYNTTIGVPYDSIFGKVPNIPLLKSYLVAAAKTVPGVTSAVVYISSIVGRNVSGQVQITNENGQTATAAF